MPSDRVKIKRFLPFRKKLKRHNNNKNPKLHTDGAIRALDSWRRQPTGVDKVKSSETDVSKPSAAVRCILLPRLANHLAMCAHVLNFIGVFCLLFCFLLLREFTTLNWINNRKRRLLLLLLILLLLADCWCWSLYSIRANGENSLLPLLCLYFAGSTGW